MQNLFNNIQVKTPPYSTFDFSHDLKMSGKMANLIPVFTKECLPGDKWSGNAEALLRLVPMTAPAMHKMEIYFHAFFVPYRLLWPNWELLITGGQIGDIPPALPVKGHFIDHVKPGSLDNYLGLPVTEGTGVQLPDVTCFRHAAYQRIWFDWYRDQNLQFYPKDEYPWTLKDGDNADSAGGFQTELETIRKRAWEHDYFTSALPFVQKGAAVGIPIDFTDAIVVARRPGSTADNPFNPIWMDSATGAPIVDNATGLGKLRFGSTNQFGSSVQHEQGGAQADTSSFYDPQGSLTVSGNAFSSINDLRAAQALQRWLEKNARGGTRYTEALRVHFGVISSDARLQRAEYLGGSKSIMAISEVLQTSSTDSASPQGNMAGHGISVSGGGLFNYRCEEHGQIMVIMSVRPKTAYYQGVPRELLKQDLQDFYFSDFAALGEQPVYNAELAVTTTGDPYGTFGYLPRYAEYRVEHNRVCGQMATTLEFWQMGRKFSITGGPIALNEDFIVCNPSKRIFAVVSPDEDEIIGHIIFKIFARRPIPQYGTPM